jgi:hypothetical protein
MEKLLALNQERATVETKSSGAKKRTSRARTAGEML